MFVTTQLCSMAPQARFPFKRMATMIGCLPTQALGFLRFSFTQRTQRKRLSLNGNRASASNLYIAYSCRCHRTQWHQWLDPSRCVSKLRGRLHRLSHFAIGLTQQLVGTTCGNGPFVCADVPLRNHSVTRI